MNLCSMNLADSSRKKPSLSKMTLLAKAKQSIGREEQLRAIIILGRGHNPFFFG